MEVTTVLEAAHIEESGEHCWADVVDVVSEQSQQGLEMQEHTKELEDGHQTKCENLNENEGDSRALSLLVSQKLASIEAAYTVGDIGSSTQLLDELDVERCLSMLEYLPHWRPMYPGLSALTGGRTWEALFADQEDQELACHVRDQHREGQGQGQAKGRKEGQEMRACAFCYFLEKEAVGILPSFRCIGAPAAYFSLGACHVMQCGVTEVD